MVKEGIAATTSKCKSLVDRRLGSFYLAWAYHTLSMALPAVSFCLHLAQNFTFNQPSNKHTPCTLTLFEVGVETAITSFTTMGTFDCSIYLPLGGPFIFTPSWATVLAPALVTKVVLVFFSKLCQLVLVNRRLTHSCPG